MTNNKYGMWRVTATIFGAYPRRPLDNKYSKWFLISNGILAGIGLLITIISSAMMGSVCLSAPPPRPSNLLPKTS